MIVYLLGHSGVGKSNAVAALGVSYPDVAVVDLDAACANHQTDWTIVGAFLADLHATADAGTDMVVDVGAGTQWLGGDCSAFADFLQLCGGPILVVTAPPREVILRQPVKGRDMGEFIQTEYTSRQDLYALATCTVDVTGLTKEESADRVVDALLRVLGRPRSSPPVQEQPALDAEALDRGPS